MTKQQFIARAIRKAEQSIYVPPGWWGTYRDVTNGTVRVKFSAPKCWRLTKNGQLVSKHDSRAHAISKARKL